MGPEIQKIKIKLKWLKKARKLVKEQIGKREKGGV